LYYHNISNSKVYYPEEIDVTLNDSVLILSVVNSTSDYFHFSICVDNKDIDSTFLGPNDINNWGRSKTSEDISNIKSTHRQTEGYNNYFVISEIDKENKTISGHFEIHNRKGYFNQLDYSSDFSPNHILFSANINLVGKGNYTSNIFDFSTVSSSLNIHHTLGEYIKFDTYEFSIGTYDWGYENNITYYPYNTYYPYYGNSGQFKVSKVEMFGHMYTKVRLWGTLKQGTYSYGETLLINNSEIILY
jgi:hypothetical protein